MDEAIKLELERLIEEGKSFENCFTYRPPYNKTKTVRSANSPMGQITISLLKGKWILKNQEQYLSWLTQCYLWVYQNYIPLLEAINSLRSELEKKTSKSKHEELINYLNIMSQKPIQEQNNSGNVITINNTQTQSQEQKQEQSQTQKMLQEVFSEAIKDELTGKQQKEIQAILEEHNDNIEEAKPKLLEKLASFGTNILAGVVGNILTNPAMIGLF